MAISGFKKFSEIKKDGKGSKIKKVSPGIEPATDSHYDTELTVPVNPGAPPIDNKKVEKIASRKKLIPKDQNINLDSPIPNEDLKKYGKNEVKLYGKIAKFPKKTKASKGYNFLENVKISKNSIWYILVEKQDNELQMVKYNNKKGVDLGKFVNELKSYYIKKYSKDKKLVKLIESIQVSGKNEFSIIKNIPYIEVDGRKMITRITEDLIRLLSK